MGKLDGRAAFITGTARGVEPLGVSHAIAWLVSDEARYVTGTVVPVDAGQLNKR